MEVSQQFQDMSCNRYYRQARSLQPPLPVLLLSLSWPEAADGERQWKDRLQAAWAFFESRLFYIAQIWCHVILKSLNMILRLPLKFFSISFLLPQQPNLIPLNQHFS